MSWGRQGQRRLKLENGHYGNVLVKMNGSSEWQGVCDDGWNTPTTGGGNWSTQNAEVICTKSKCLAEKQKTDVIYSSS